jgi:chorismate mutase-like protein
MLVDRMASRPPLDPALAGLRERIDRLNRRLLELVQERGELVLEVAALKETLGLDSYDPRREAEMIRSLTAQPDGPFSAQELETIFRALFAASLELQRRVRARASAADHPHSLPHIKSAAT